MCTCGCCWISWLDSVLCLFHLELYSQFLMFLELSSVLVVLCDSIGGALKVLSYGVTYYLLVPRRSKAADVVSVIPHSFFCSFTCQKLTALCHLLFRKRFFLFSLNWKVHTWLYKCIPVWCLINFIFVSAGKSKPAIGLLHHCRRQDRSLANSLQPSSSMFCISISKCCSKGSSCAWFSCSQFLCETVRLEQLACPTLARRPSQIAWSAVNLSSQWKTDHELLA